MRTFEPGDIVRLPFPYADRNTVQHRPGLVVSSTGQGVAGSLYWVVMITSAENRSWPHDVPIGDGHNDLGLPIPSVIRPAKIASVDASRIEAVGRLPQPVMDKVRAGIAAILS